MIISLLVAMDENRGIGKNNQLPWHLSEDLKRFKALTMDHHIVMGRKTYESIGRSLPGRTIIVVTRNPEYTAENGVLITNSLPEALELAEKSGEHEVFVVGGAEIFSQTLPIADKIYITRVHARVDADVLFPAFDQGAWTEQESFWMDADHKNDYPMTFKVLVKKDN